MINCLFVQKETLTFAAEKNIHSYYPTRDVKK